MWDGVLNQIFLRLSPTGTAHFLRGGTSYQRLYQFLCSSRQGGFEIISALAYSAKKNRNTACTLLTSSSASSFFRAPSWAGCAR